MLRFLCALGAFVAASASLSAQTAHPAHADAPAAPVVLAASPLAPAPPADVPAALRPATSAHHAAGHAHTAHAAATRPAADVPAGLAATLDAYLALHDALASDRMDGVAASARALAAAFGPMTETAPAGDPHFWHTRATETGAVLTQAEALADAATLQDARLAFGRLSAPLAALVDATGVPQGYDLATHRCGMAADIPDGGVWLQPSGDTRNPYFGSAMPTCGRPAEAHGAHGHAHTMRTDTLIPSARGHAGAVRAGGAETAGCCTADGCEAGCCSDGDGCCEAGCCGGEDGCCSDAGTCSHPADHAGSDPGSCCCGSMAGGPHGSACAMGSHAHGAPSGSGR